MEHLISNNRDSHGIAIWFVRIAMVLFLMGLVFGYWASKSYENINTNNQVLGFLSLRPMHVSAVYLGITSAGIGLISLAIQKNRKSNFGIRMQQMQLLLWVIALIGIFYSYLFGQFGGREYWEFNPIWAIPLFLSFGCFLIYFLHQVKLVKPWPVYYWMWFTGIVFYMFCFLENYLWLFPYFKSKLIEDMTIQWKVNGSIVGAVNQMIYGVAFYVMEKISGVKESAYKKVTFAVYFLGLFNLMFNWGHHIYLLPTEKFIHHIAYIVSMTEWVLLIRIFFLWKAQIAKDKRFFRLYPYKFLMASDYWVMLNLILALFMSIPAINLYTHGTHITVAHAMGTTIGINTMIILGSLFYYLQPQMRSKTTRKFFVLIFWGAQFSLFTFLCSLVFMGIHRSKWQAVASSISFREMYIGMTGNIHAFILSGIMLALCLGAFFALLLWRSMARNSET